MNKKLNAVILSGGQSSRMKENKALLSFENSTILEFLYKKLSKIFNKVYICSKQQIHNYETIIDNDKIFSPMIALDSIFEKLKDEELFIISVDLPLINEKTILKLIDEYSKNSFEIIIPVDKEENKHNLCGIFNHSIHEKIKTCLKNDIHKINYLIRQSNYHYLKIDSIDEFININTKEDYIKALNILDN